MDEKGFILRILKKHSIRKIDGRWQDGFVDLKILQSVIDEGVAEEYKLQGMTFVRLKEVERAAE